MNLTSIACILTLITVVSASGAWTNWYGQENAKYAKLESAVNNTYIKEICVRFNWNRVRGIQAYFSDNTQSIWGGSSSDSYDYDCYSVNKDECFSSVTVTYETWIDSVQFKTTDIQITPLWGRSGQQSSVIGYGRDHCISKLNVYGSLWIQGIQFYFIPKANITLAPTMDPTKEPTVTPSLPTQSPTTAMPTDVTVSPTPAPSLPTESPTAARCYVRYTLWTGSSYDEPIGRCFERYNGYGAIYSCVDTDKIHAIIRANSDCTGTLDTYATFNDGDSNGYESWEIKCTPGCSSTYSPTTSQPSISQLFRLWIRPLLNQHRLPLNPQQQHLLYQPMNRHWDQQQEYGAKHGVQDQHVTVIHKFLKQNQSMIILMRYVHILIPQWLVLK
eukprot:128932_1